MVFSHLGFFHVKNCLVSCAVYFDIFTALYWLISFCWIGWYFLVYWEKVILGETLFLVEPVVEVCFFPTKWYQSCG